MPKPPILFVHAAHHGPWCWREHWLPAAESRGWPCHTVRLREPGEDRDGRWMRPRTPLGHFEGEVIEAMEEMPEPPVLVGHAMGARIVERVLSREEARAGVLVSPLDPRGAYRMGWNVAKRHPQDLLRLVRKGELPRRREYFFSPRLDDERAERHLERMRDESRAVHLQTQLPVRAPQLEVPVLVLGGEDDALVDPVSVVRTARHHGTQARLFRGMGHDLMLDAGWRAPLEVMLHWLDDTL